MRKAALAIAVGLAVVAALPAPSLAARAQILIRTNPAGPAAPGEPVELAATVLEAPHASVAWSVAPAPSVQVTLHRESARRAMFEASLPGTYVVTAVSPPAVRTFTIRVYGPPAAVVLRPWRNRLAADGQARDTLGVRVVDARGTRVGAFVGSVTLVDTGGQLCGRSHVVVAIRGGAGLATLCAATRPGTDEIRAGDLVTDPERVAVTGVTYGTTTVRDVPAGATRLGLTAVRGGLRLVVARPGPGVMAIRPVTWIAAARPQPVTVAVAVYDEANDAMPAPRTVSVRLSGPASLARYAEVRTATLRYPAAATFTVWSNGRPGAIEVSAAAAGLPPATYTVQAVASGPPAHFQILVSRAFDDRGMPYNLYDVRLVDARRRPVPGAGGSIQVSDDSADLPALGGHGHAAMVYAPAAAAQQAVAYRPGPASFPVVAGGAVFAVESRPGSARPATMTITDPALGLAAHLPYVWATGRPAVAVLTATVPPTAQVADANGNPVPEAGLPVLFTIGATRAWALTDAAGVASVTGAGLGAQTVTVSFPAAP